MSFYDLSAKSINGSSESLSAYKGKVSLVVNVASECGFTPQYSGLQALWEEKKDAGLVVLGFPSNEFGGQEPGSESEIKTFCQTNFGVSFPMFAKVQTKGADASPVYSFLTASHDAPKWNFHKFLVGKEGQVLASFASNVAPDSKELRAAIDVALAQ